MLDAMRDHWPEYLREGAGLGFFMVSACAFTTLLWHPTSPAVAAIPAPLLGMLAAAEWSLRAQGAHTVLCAQLHHDNPSRCIFRCAYGSAQ